MNFYLTAKLIIVENGPFIPRKEFEEWLIMWHPLDFPEICSSDLIDQFWAGKMKYRQPEVDIKDYVLQFALDNNEFEGIEKVIKSITDEVVVFDARQN